MKQTKAIYWIATSLMSVLFFAGGLMYIFNYPRAHAFFMNLGFPTWLIYPLAILKISGVVAILSRRSLFLKELAYAGFLYDAVLALAAHLIVKDGEAMPAVVSLIVIMTSWVYDRKVFGVFAQEFILDKALAKRHQVIYWIATGFISFMFFAGAMMYFFNYTMAHQFFTNLGFPTWIIYPLGILKVLGVVAVLSKKSTLLKELAYAGFLYDAVLAVTAHLVVSDGQYLHGMAVIIATIISWIYDRKVFGKHQQRLPVGQKKAEKIVETTSTV